MTPPEIALWMGLRGKQLRGLKFRRQHPVEPYVLDFYCAEARLAVEVDGSSHENTGTRDARRDAWLLDRGITTLRIPARDVFENLEGVLGHIARTAQASD